MSAFDDDEHRHTGLPRHVDTELELLANVRNLEQRVRALRRRPRSRVIGHADQLPAGALHTLEARLADAVDDGHPAVSVTTPILGALLAEVRRGRAR